jgi:hypothetical protein
MPRNGPERDEFLKTGVVAEPKPKTEKAAEPKARREPEAASTPANDKSDTVPPAEAGKDRKQAARAERPKTDAETRLPELLSERKQLLARIKELESAPPKAAPETREPASKPAEAFKLPEFTKPKPELKNFDDVEKYTDALTDWKIEKSTFDRDLKEKVERSNREISDMKAKANEKYGEDVTPKISSTYTRIVQDAQMPTIIRTMIEKSPIPVDLLYVLGPEIESFSELAKTAPDQALRKLILLEKLTQDEIAGKTQVSRETQGETATPQRGDDGKFVKAAEEPPRPPVKKVNPAPPPPMEAGGLRPAPPDDLEALYERINAGTATAKDTNRAMQLENEREIARRRNGNR